jgi:hypothetical protein
MSKTLSLSPDRGEFSMTRYREKLEADPDDEDAFKMLEYYMDWKARVKEQQQDPIWQKNNLEYDLLTTDWILEKVRTQEYYAQNLYAAMCNNQFQRNDVWPILSEQKWSCSWRHAGGVISDMLGKGDYIDWYCSGINGDQDEMTQGEWENLTPEQQTRYKDSLLFVRESVVTEEIENDLFELGWLVIKEDDRDI